MKDSLELVQQKVQRVKRGDVERKEKTDDGTEKQRSFHIHNERKCVEGVGLE